jgi:hypothetical protein
VSATASRPIVLRVLLVGLLVLAGAWLALDEGQAELALASEEEVSPLPEHEPRCRLAGAEALAHARSVEQMATARWERVPFALREAPRAVEQMAEAQACYEAGGDRDGRMRSAARQRAYEAEVLRRFARARLLLRAASMPVRESSGAARDEDGREERARRQVATLLALLERAPEGAQAFRQELMRLEQAYAASAAERARAGQDSDDDEEE